MSLIPGVGVDIVDVERLRQLVRRTGEAALARLFTTAERDDLHGARGWRWESLAGRFAAKEATRKLFGTHGEMPRFTDIEVTTGRHGEPVLTLLGDAVEVGRRRGLHGLHGLQLSIAHERHSAIAIVIAH